MVSRPLLHPGTRTHLLAAVILFLWVPGPSLADEPNPWWQDEVLEVQRANTPVFITGCHLGSEWRPEVSFLIFAVGATKGKFLQLGGAVEGATATFENSGTVDFRNGHVHSQIDFFGFVVHAAEAQIVLFLTKTKFQLVLPSQFAKLDIYKIAKQECG